MLCSDRLTETRQAAPRSVIISSRTLCTTCTVHHQPMYMAAAMAAVGKRSCRYLVAVRMLNRPPVSGSDHHRLGHCSSLSTRYANDGQQSKLHNEGEIPAHDRHKRTGTTCRLSSPTYWLLPAAYNGNRKKTLTAK